MAKRQTAVVLTQAQCGQLRTHGRWSHADYWYCLDRAPLGSTREQLRTTRSRELTDNRQAPR